MPRVQYTNKAQNISVTKDLVTPKRMSELRYWLKGAQSQIPHIPWKIAESEISADRSMGSDGWFVATTDVDEKWIRFDLENRFGNKAQIVIDRKYNAMKGI